MANKNTQLRFTQAGTKMKNICKEFFNMAPTIISDIPDTRQLSDFCQMENNINKNDKNKLNTIDQSGKKNNPRKSSMAVKTQISEKERLNQKYIKNDVYDQNTLRCSASSNVIFKYSDVCKGNRKNTLETIKIGRQNVEFRKTFNSSDKNNVQKSYENPIGLSKLQNTLNYLQSRVNTVKNQLFRKKQLKLNTSTITPNINQPSFQFSQQNTKESQISQNTICTVKKLTTGSHFRISSLVAGQPKPKDLRYFDRNPYSGRSNIYYVSEVIRAKNERNSIAIQHINSSITSLKYLHQRQDTPRFSEAHQKKINLKKKDYYKDKKTIIFDLDQTLVHCNQNTQMDCDVKLAADFGQLGKFTICLNIRPHALLLLNELAKNFELIVFTASQSQYANIVLDYLDPQNRLFQHRLYRQHCTQISNDIYIKDLRRINRNLSQMVLVDNSAVSYSFQLQNGIPILPYYQGNIDFELKALGVYLNELMNVKDVREVNKRVFKLHHYTKFDSSQQLIEELYIN